MTNELFNDRQLTSIRSDSLGSIAHSASGSPLLQSLRPTTSGVSEGLSHVQMAEPSKIAGHPVFTGVSFVPLAPRTPINITTKRIIDLGCALVGIILLVPIFILVALAIKLTSKGPVLFSQVRVTQGGRHFRIFKFRTMVPEAEKLQQDLFVKNEAGGPVFKMKNDPRITLIGKYLRKSSLDELPQLFNIVRGEMSIVGPRPPLPSEVALYEPWQTRRLSVLPGLTCTWQVSGRSHITFEDWMRMDLDYIDSWSLMKDLKLILLTIHVVLTGRGAY